MTNINELITEAADLIRVYNAKLADAFVAQPLRRVDLAHAFAAGFEGDDVHPAASAVIRCAYLDRDQRRAQTAYAKAVELGIIKPKTGATQ